MMEESDESTILPPALKLTTCRCGSDCDGTCSCRCVFCDAKHIKYGDYSPKVVVQGDSVYLFIHMNQYSMDENDEWLLCMRFDTSSFLSSLVLPYYGSSTVVSVKNETDMFKYVCRDFDSRLCEVIGCCPDVAYHILHVLIIQKYECQFENSDNSLTLRVLERNEEGIQDEIHEEDLGDAVDFVSACVGHYKSTITHYSLCLHQCNTCWDALALNTSDCEHRNLCYDCATTGFCVLCGAPWHTYHSYCPDCNVCGDSGADSCGCMSIHGTQARTGDRIPIATEDDPEVESAWFSSLKVQQI